MSAGQSTDAISGKRFRWTFTDGPAIGRTFEHSFHEDGTVTWRAVDTDAPRGGEGRGERAAEDRSHYAALEAGEGVYVVSCLAESGYTLTVVLNLADRRMSGYAHGGNGWHPVTGTFQQVEWRD